MKKFLMVMAGIFGVATIILYFSSIHKLDSASARYLGISETINIQGTVFCAACAVICALNVVGALILQYLEDNVTSAAPVSYSDMDIQTEDGDVVMTSTNYWVCPNCKNRNPFSKIECKECGYVRD